MGVASISLQGLAELASESADAAQDAQDLLDEYLDAAAHAGAGARRDPDCVMSELIEAIADVRIATRETRDEAERRAR
jgi:hypothetical protein